MDDLTLTRELEGGPAFPALTDDVLRKTRKIIDEGTPPNTKRAYSSDMAYIRAWCAAMGFETALPLSVEMVVTFIADHVEGLQPGVDRELVASGAKKDFGVPAISTLKRRVYTLSTAHSIAGVENPCADARVKELLSRAGRAAVRNGWTRRKKTAAALQTLERLLATCGEVRAHDIRDRAMLLFGWSSGGRRRSEIAEALFERLEAHGENYVYDLGVTKTDQEGETGAVPVAGRAALAMREWLELRGDAPGPLFFPIAPDGFIERRKMHPESVALVVRRRAKRAGLEASKFAGHSLRSGFMTEAGLQGINLKEAMELSKHKTLQVAGGYYQAGAGLANKGAKLAG